MTPMRFETRRARQCLHHVETAGLGDNDRRRHPPLQVGGVGAGRDNDVAALGGHALADVARRLVESQMNRLDGGKVVVLERDVAEQVGQARHRDGPDDRQVDVFGAGSRIGHRLIVLQAFQCFNMKRLLKHRLKQSMFQNLATLRGCLISNGFLLLLRQQGAGTYRAI